MPCFSANLGFLWTDLSLPEAIRAAHAAGFVAVELHWPYATPAADVQTALHETGLPVLGLNTDRGDVSGGENGLSALPDREDDAKAAIDQALAYARAIGAGAVHVMAGNAAGDAAHSVFLSNLRYACAKAAPLGITILIEPLNRNDAPDYFLKTTDQAAAIIDSVSEPNLKLMFDCYHVGRTEGDVLTRLTALLSHVGHIQFASVPDRGPPDHGELDYVHIFAAIDALKWSRPLGAEYKPVGPTDTTLGWMKTIANLTKSSAEMVAQARGRISEVETPDLIASLDDPDIVIVDIRDIRERQRSGFIPGSIHAPRGMLEFWIDPESPYFKPVFGQDKTYIFHCASGWRSALTVATLLDMGFKAAHLKDGFSTWEEQGGPVEFPEPSK